MKLGHSELSLSTRFPLQFLSLDDLFFSDTFFHDTVCNPDFTQTLVSVDALEDQST